MRKYLYLIKKQKIKSWLKFWLLTNNKFNSILSNIIEGTSFDLQNTVKRYFKIFNIFGNSVQDGIPSPENPVPIDSVADDVNLLNVPSIYSVTLQDNIAVDLNAGTYILSAENIETQSSQNVFLVQLTKSDSTIQSLYVYFNDKKVSFTIDTKVTNIKIYSSNNYNDSVGKTTTFTKLMIKKGSTLLPYSPYNYGTFTIDFEGQTENYNYTFITKPLRSLPNGVKDIIEADGIHRRVGRRLLQASDIHTIVTTGTVPYVRIDKLTLGMVKGTFANNTALMKSYAITGNINYSNTSSGQFNTYYDKYFLAIFDDRFTDLATAKQLLEGEEIIYELAEEVIEPYTEEQQEQYNKIKELYTFDGTTNISSDDEVPPYLQIQYYMKGE